MAGNVFLNYRRADDAGFATALFQHLDQSLGAGRVFMDVEGFIKPGDDFVDVLSRQVEACDVLLVVIGPKWLDLLMARSELSDDFVTIEISAAIERSKRIIPVLVNGASMPLASALPPALKPLTRRHAVALRPDRFRADCEALAAALRRDIDTASERSSATLQAEMQARVKPAAEANFPPPQFAGDAVAAHVGPTASGPALQVVAALDATNAEREKIFIREFDDQLQAGEKTQFAMIYVLTYLLIAASAVAFALLIAAPLVATLFKATSR